MLIPLKDKNPIRTFPYVTIALIIVNIYIFLLQGPLGSERVAVNLWYRLGFIPELFVNQFNKAEYDRAWDRLKLEFQQKPWRSRGLLSRLQEAQERRLLLRDLDKVQQSGRRKEWLTLLTCLFLHGSLWHLLANMWFLWVFGNNIEDACGHAKFLLFYLLCGVLASFGHMGVNPHSVVPTIGASGGISGIMGAYMVLFPAARVLTILPFFLFLWYPIELPAYLYLGYWILIQVLLGQLSLTQPGAGGTAWFAHVGGFFAGLLLIFAFKKREIRSAVPFLGD